MDNRVKRYITESYKYYITYEENSISDSEYDYLCQELLAEWDTLSTEDQSMLDQDNLKAGTGFDIPMSVYDKLKG